MVDRLKIFLQPVPFVLLIMMILTVTAHEYLVNGLPLASAVLWGLGTAFGIVAMLMALDFCFRGFRWR